jgi:hypothetical protein
MSSKYGWLGLVLFSIGQVLKALVGVSHPELGPIIDVVLTHLPLGLTASGIGLLAVSDPIHKQK